MKSRILFFVVSHGDMHTGNIVTHSEISDLTKNPSTSTKEFGVIDWESITFDTPGGDVADFWLHHQRQARKVCKNYEFGFSEFSHIYTQKLREYAKRYNTPIEVSSARDLLIQSALWNIYEMFDPVRKNKRDIRRKAKTHYELLLSDLENLKQDTDCREIAHTIESEAKALLSPYLEN